MTPYGKAPLRGLFDDTNAPTITLKNADGLGATASKIVAMKVTFTDNDDNVEENTNENGTLDGFLDKKPRVSIMLEARIKADSKANARTALKLPDPFSEVVLANFVSSTHTLLNATWVYTRGGEIELTEGEDDDAKIKIPLKRYFKPDGTAVDTSVATGALKRIT